MIGASAPALIAEYFQSAKSPHLAPPAALDQPRDQGYLQYSNSEERGTEQVPFIVKVIPSEPTPKQENREKEKANQDRRLADYTEFLFFATCFLGVATFGLAVAAFLQIRDTKKAIEVARISARAADRHSRTAIGVELPRFLVKSASFPFAGEDLERALRDHFPNILLNNFGRTSAQITMTSIDWIVCNTLPEPPEYFEVRGVEIGSVIDQGKVYEIHRFRRRPLSEDEIKDVINTERRLWVYGFIGFKDFMYVDWKTGFCLWLDVFRTPFFGEGEQITGVLRYGGPHTYNRTTPE
jgi:hypothetical protein